MTTRLIRRTTLIAFPFACAFAGIVLGPAVVLLAVLTGMEP